MILNRTVELYVAATILLGSFGVAHAAPFMIVGNDEKALWDDKGKLVLSPSGFSIGSSWSTVGPPRPASAQAVSLTVVRETLASKSASAVSLPRSRAHGASPVLRAQSTVMAMPSSTLVRGRKPAFAALSME